MVVPRPLDSEAFVFIARPVGKLARSASTVPFTMPPVRAEAEMVEAGTSAETAMAPAAMEEERAAEGESANGVAAVLAGGGCALVDFVGRFSCCLDTRRSSVVAAFAVEAFAALEAAGL